MELFDRDIEQFYQAASLKNALQKIQVAAELFLDKPYVFEPLGEGASGQYYQEPLYRTDQFDCVSFVDILLSLIRSNNLSEFKCNINLVRYIDNKIQYNNRTDWFTDLDWLPNARKLGWIEDITSQFTDINDQPIDQVAKTIIDKPRWYAVKTKRALHLLKLIDTIQQDKLLAQLHSEGSAYTPQPSEINYLPTNRLLTENKKINPYYVEQFPLLSVVVFIRPNWDIRDKFKDYPQGYGTNLNVCHIGILSKVNNEIILSHASASAQKVVQHPLEEYLMCMESIKGIHIEKIIY